LRKDYSLKKSIQFKEVFNKGKRYSREGIQLIVLKNRDCGDRLREGQTERGHDGVRVGISINSRYGNAVARNRAKRRLRSLCTELLPVMKEGYLIVLRPDENFKTMEFDSARDSMRRLFQKAGILKQ
jgi:ribonuclease P protein component